MGIKGRARRNRGKKRNSKTTAAAAAESSLLLLDTSASAPAPAAVLPGHHKNTISTTEPEATAVLKAAIFEMVAQGPAAVKGAGDGLSEEPTRARGRGTVSARGVGATVQGPS